MVGRGQPSLVHWAAFYTLPRYKKIMPQTAALHRDIPVCALLYICFYFFLPSFGTSYVCYLSYLVVFRTARGSSALRHYISHGFLFLIVHHPFSCQSVGAWAVTRESFFFRCLYCPRTSCYFERLVLRFVEPSVPAIVKCHVLTRSLLPEYTWLRGTNLSRFPCDLGAALLCLLFYREILHIFSPMTSPKRCPHASMSGLRYFMICIFPTSVVITMPYCSRR